MVIISGVPIFRIFTVPYFCPVDERFVRIPGKHQMINNVDHRQSALYGRSGVGLFCLCRPICLDSLNVYSI